MYIDDTSMKESKPKLNKDGTVTMNCSKCGEDIIIQRNALDYKCSKCGNCHWKLRIKRPK